VGRAVRRPIVQRSYIARVPVNFVEFNFFIKAGDILVHDASNANKLTVYRGGEIVKVMTQTALGLAAMVKSEFIVETGAPTAKSTPKTPKDAPKPPEAKGVARAPETKPEAPQTPPDAIKPPSKPSSAEIKAKRAKAVPKEVSQDDPEFRRRMGLDPMPEVEDETV